jgi:hypothetical protein
MEIIFSCPQRSRTIDLEDSAAIVPGKLSDINIIEYIDTVEPLVRLVLGGEPLQLAIAY